MKKYPKIYLKPKKEIPVLRFHPWVFSGAIGKKEGVAKDGDFLEVINNNGNIRSPVSQMLWIEKRDRVYEVKTTEKLYLVRKTLSELEGLLLPKGFIRINRAVIVNRAYVHNYSFWEYDKFILRMKDDGLTEFIVSRERMRQIKSQLQQRVEE